jgi:hypothetical protein
VLNSVATDLIQWRTLHVSLRAATSKFPWFGKTSAIRYFQMLSYQPLLNITPPIEPGKYMIISVESGLAMSALRGTFSTMVCEHRHNGKNQQVRMFWFRL